MLLNFEIKKNFVLSYEFKIWDKNDINESGSILQILLSLLDSRLTKIFKYFIIFTIRNEFSNICVHETRSIIRDILVIVCYCIPELHHLLTLRKYIEIFPLMVGASYALGLADIGQIGSWQYFSCTSLFKINVVWIQFNCK